VPCPSSRCLAGSMTRGRRHFHRARAGKYGPWSFFRDSLALGCCVRSESGRGLVGVQGVRPLCRPP
jgi:hypothetical protein